MDGRAVSAGTRGGARGVAREIAREIAHLASAGARRAVAAKATRVVILRGGGCAAERVAHRFVVALGGYF